MSRTPEELRYTASHEWIKTEADGTVSIGITDHAQDALGDLVYVELPKAGAKYAADAACAVVESVKAASDVYAPIAGEVVESNPALEASPELINQDPYGKGWMFRLRPADPNAVATLLDAAGYRATLG